MLSSEIGFILASRALDEDGHDANADDRPGERIDQHLNQMAVIGSRQAQGVANQIAGQQDRPSQSCADRGGIPHYVFLFKRHKTIGACCTKSNIQYTSLRQGGTKMRLTVYTDYALRLLMYLALKDDGLATIAEVAKAYQISKNHLMKVAYELGVAGDIETVRGRNGGLKLSRPVDSIIIGDVVRRTEPDMALVPCFSSANESCAVRPN